jgi:hypothetical protein
MRVVVRSLDAAWRPAQGDFFDAVLAALEFAGVPALVVESGAASRGALRGTVTAERNVERPPEEPEEPEECHGCGGEIGPDGCAVCDACRDCCSCA